MARLRIIFVGDFDEIEMQKYVIRAYHLVPDELSKGLFKNETPNRFQFSRMGADKYAMDIINHDVALKDGPEPKTRLPPL